MAEEGLVLTERQLAALEKKKERDQLHGEIETAHPGYLGTQDTFYVGTLKEVGRIYQQTFLDTYAEGGICEVVNDEDPAHGRGVAQRSGVTFLRRARDGTVGGADRSWDRVLWPS